MKRTALKRGRGMQRTVIRQLGPNEPDPEGEPRRHKAGGVLRLRWKIAPYTYAQRTTRDPDGPVARTKPRSIPAFELEFQKMRPKVRQRSGGLCEVQTSADCQGRAAHVHHRRLRSQAGANSMENLLDVCLPCHGAIHSDVARSYERGLLVRSTDDPALVPVMSGLE